MGALEETSVAEARQQFETNFFGVLRVTNAILPGMRQQGDGRIVNISSVLGFLPAPYMGNLCREQTCSRRIYRDAGSRDQEVRRARGVGRTGIYEDETQRKHQIRKNLSRGLRGGTKASDRSRLSKTSNAETILEGWRKRFGTH